LVIAVPPKIASYYQRSGRLQARRHEKTRLAPGTYFPRGPAGQSGFKK
jgi:hypothetical protein